MTNSAKKLTVNNVSKTDLTQDEIHARLIHKTTGFTQSFERHEEFKQHFDQAQHGEIVPSYSGMLPIAQLLYNYRGTTPQSEESIAETGGNIANDSNELMDNYWGFQLTSTLKQIIDNAEWLRKDETTYNGKPTGSKVRVKHIKKQIRTEFGTSVEVSSLDEISRMTLMRLINEKQVYEMKDLALMTLQADARLVHELATGKVVTPWLRPSKGKPEVTSETNLDDAALQAALDAMK